MIYWEQGRLGLGLGWDGMVWLLAGWLVGWLAGWLLAGGLGLTRARTLSGLCGVLVCGLSHPSPYTCVLECVCAVRRVA